MKILMVLTSHDQLGNTGRKTGFWLEEFAAPYFVFRDAGVELTLASPKGGQPPLDPKSDLPENQTPAMARFRKDAAAQKALASTIKLADVKAEDFDTVFYPGGHGPMWGSRGKPCVDRPAGGLLQFWQANRIGVPFARGASPYVTYQGAPLVKGKTHRRFHPNGEEEAMQLTKVVLCCSWSRMNCCGSAPYTRRWQTGSLFPSLTAVSLPARILRRPPRQLRRF